jgi:hypothetical protein
MVYPKTEIRSNSQLETQGLSATAAKKGVYTEEKWENAPVKHSMYEGQGNADII